MSTFNKLFIASVIAATLLAVAHTGVYAWRTSQAIDATQGSEVASMVSFTLNALSGLPAASATRR